METVELELIVDNIFLTVILDSDDNDILEILINGQYLTDYLTKEFVDKVEEKLVELGYGRTESY
jgi:succinate dehydrogenase flavin-adding protein (antitoxin of CptAB toxin-antitoxin module)